MVFRNFSKIVSCQEILKGESELLKLVCYQNDAYVSLG